MIIGVLIGAAIATVIAVTVPRQPSKYKSPLDFGVGSKVRIRQQYFDTELSEIEYTPDTVFTISGEKWYNGSCCLSLHNTDDSVRLTLSEFWLERAN